MLSAEKSEPIKIRLRFLRVLFCRCTASKPPINQIGTSIANTFLAETRAHFEESPPMSTTITRTVGESSRFAGDGNGPPVMVETGNIPASQLSSGPADIPAFKTVTDAMGFLRQNNVRFVLAQFVDIHGVAKTKSVPVSHFQDILDEGAGFAGFALWGFGMEPHSPDYMARGELNTLTLVPWQPGYARIVCTGYVNNKPYPYDTRWILNQQMKRLAERGWTLNTGLEPEFMLLSRK